MLLQTLTYDGMQVNGFGVWRLGLWSKALYTGYWLTCSLFHFLYCQFTRP